jgi:hypothetical protein
MKVPIFQLSIYTIEWSLCVCVCVSFRKTSRSLDHIAKFWLCSPLQYCPASKWYQFQLSTPPRSPWVIKFVFLCIVRKTTSLFAPTAYFCFVRKTTSFYAHKKYCIPKGISSVSIATANEWSIRGSELSVCHRVGSTSHNFMPFILVYFTDFFIIL